MMLMIKHCSSIYFRCKTTELAFTLAVTVMLLLTDLTSAPGNKSIGIKYCQKIRGKSIADNHIDTASPILAPVLKKYRRYYWYQYQYCDINNPGCDIL